jgi:hypothetical protein
MDATDRESLKEQLKTLAAGREEGIKQTLMLACLRRSVLDGNLEAGEERGLEASNP